MADVIADLLERLLGAVDERFTPPAFDAAIAEAVLGPSGAPRTPHRRLLELRNGGYFLGGALHVFGACDGPAWHGLRSWNAPSLWRDAYGDELADLIFFAEDAFGDQFAYSGNGGAVVIVEAELGRVQSVAPHFTAWLEQIVEAPESALPIEVMRRHEAQHRPLAPGEQLFAYPPLCTVEAAQGEVTLGQVDAVEAMRFRGALAQKLRDLPVGTRVKIDIE